MITSRLAKLWRSLSRSKEYRDAFAAAQVNAGVSFQIRANRVSRGMTQEEFGALWGAKQSFVARMENPDLARPNLQTLQRIAQALDVALIVKFASFSELAGWVAQYGENGFAVASLGPHNQSVEHLCAMQNVEHRRRWEEWFWSVLQREEGEDGCWEWVRARHERGYGRVRFEGKITGTHRVAYKLAKGELRDRDLVLHRCDNPPCCNPAHLYVGTHAQNARDRAERGVVYENGSEAQLRRARQQLAHWQERVAHFERMKRLYEERGEGEWNSRVG